MGAPNPPAQPDQPVWIGTLELARWQAHFTSLGVTRNDVELSADQIDRPFLLEQRQAYSAGARATPPTRPR
jgi:hypothetical protein